MSRATIYDAVGGDGGFLRLAAAFHTRCLADPVLEHPFSHGTNPEHVPRLAAYWAEVLGGPTWYSDHAGGQDFMVGLHAHMGADDDLPGRFVACFLAALDDAAVPADPELRATLQAYMEWATADVHTVSPQGAPIPPDQVMPRWGWGGLERSPS